MADDVSKLGVQLVAENEDEFSGALNRAGEATGAFEAAAGSAQQGIDVFGTIVGGALLEVGRIAVDSLMQAGQALVGFAQAGFDSALDAEKSLTKISTLIESTGGKAGMALGDVTELGTRFMDLAGGSDDAVLAIQEMALRMGNITKDEMPAFIQTTLDMAAATGQDAVSAARLLAMAQDDPVSALGRLRRMGILVDDATKDQIKAMVKAGDTAGAYALVMNRVGESTKGAAEAMAGTLSGKIELIKGHFSEAGEAIFMSFLPPLETLFDKVIKPAIPLIDSLSADIGSFFTALLSGVDPLTSVAQLVGQVGEAFGLTQEQSIGIQVGILGLRDTFERLWVVGQQVFDFLVQAGTNVVNFFIANWPLIQSTAETVFGAFKQVAQSVGDFIFGTLIPAFNKITGTIDTDLPPAQTIFETVMAAISAGVTMAADFITNVLVPAFTKAVDWFVANWPTIQATVERVIGAVRDFIQSVLDGLRTFWDIWGDDIMKIVDVFTSGIQTTIKIFGDAFRGDWRKLGEDLREQFDKAWEAIKQVVKDAIAWFGTIDWGQVGSDIIRGIADGITAGVGWLTDAARAAAQAALDAAKGFLGIHSPSSTAAKEIGKPFVTGIVDELLNGVQQIQSASTSLAGAMIAPAASAMQMMNTTTNYNRSANVQFGNVSVNNGMDLAQLRFFIQQTVMEMA